VLIFEENIRFSMTRTSISVPYELRAFCVVLNFVACGVLVIIRVYHQRNQEIEQRKVTLTCLSCLLVALIYCLITANTQMEWYFGDVQWCSLSRKMAATTYALWRILLYLFIIFRLEVINQSNFVSSRIINAGKAAIVVAGIFMVVSTIVFTKGFTDEHFNCLFEIDDRIILVLFMIDASVCIGGTWMFIRPLAQITRQIENIQIQYILRKTKIWSIVCFTSTLVAMLTVAAFDGAVGVFAFDCSITSFSLVIMMAPMSERRKTIIMVQMDIVEKTRASSPSPTSDCDLRPSDIRLNEQIDACLGEDSMNTDDRDSVTISNIKDRN